MGTPPQRRHLSPARGKAPPSGTTSGMAAGGDVHSGPFGRPERSRQLSGQRRGEPHVRPPVVFDRRPSGRRCARRPRTGDRRARQRGIPDPASPGHDQPGAGRRAQDRQRLRPPHRDRASDRGRPPAGGGSRRPCVRRRAGPRRRTAPGARSALHRQRLPRDAGPGASFRERARGGGGGGGGGDRRIVSSGGDRASDRERPDQPGHSGRHRSSGR